jgi:hypothetical protein
MQLSRIQKKVAFNSLSHHAPSFEIHQELKGVNSLAAIGAVLRGLATLVAWSSLLRTFPRSADYGVAGSVYSLLSEHHTRSFPWESRADCE